MFLKGLKQRIDDFFIIPLKTKSFDKDGYIQRIESGEWKDRVVLGISTHERDFLSVDPVSKPGQFTFGTMGSGKSIACSFMVYTHLMCNSENTLYILVDAEKGMNDYKYAFPYKENVIKALDSTDKFIAIMDMVTEEIELRKHAFSKVGAKNIYEYEEIMKKKEGDKFPGLARVILAIEEFHSLTNAKQINFHMNMDRHGTAAYQFKSFMRVSRSYGFNVIIASQRGTSEDVPSSFKPGLNTIMGFRVNNAGDASILPGASEIRSGQAGLCAYEAGYMQFPFFEKGLVEQLLPKYVKSLKAKLLGKQVSDYHLAMEQEGSEGLVLVKPIVSLLSARGQFKPTSIAKRILKEFDFTFEDQPNAALVANLIAERDGVRYAVVVLSERGDASSKAISNLRASLGQLQCQKVLVLSFDSSVPSALTNLVGDTDGIIVERDEIDQLATLIDSKSLFEKQENYQERYDQISLSRAAQKANKDEPEEDHDGDDEGEENESSEEDFMERALRFRQGQPDSKPRRYRG